MFWIFTSFVAVLITFSESRSLGETKHAEILKYENKIDELGRYKFFYETSNNVRRQEEGALANPRSEDAGLVVKGFYSYTGSDGQNHEVHYTADKQGFHPQVNAAYPGDSASLYKPPVKPEFPLPSTTTRLPPLQALVPVNPIGSPAIASLAGGGK